MKQLNFQMLKGYKLVAPLNMTEQTLSWTKYQPNFAKYQRSRVSFASEFLLLNLVGIQRQHSEESISGSTKEMFSRAKICQQTLT